MFPGSIFGPYMAMISGVGRDRQDSLGEGAILAMAQDGTVILAHVDSFGTERLLHGRFLDPASYVVMETTDPGVTAIDRGSVVLSKDGKKGAYYTTNFNTSEVRLHVIDMSSGTPQIMKEILIPTQNIFIPFPAPAFNHDGTRLAYCDGDPFKDGYRLGIIPLAGNSTPQYIADNLKMFGSAVSPDWSAENGTIFFAGMDQFTYTRSVIYSKATDPLDGTPATPLIVSDTDVMLLQPTLSPDETRIAYVAMLPNGRTSIHIRDIAEGTDRAIRSARGTVWALRWSPDGTRLLYTDDDSGQGIAPDYQIPSGVLMTVDVASGEAYPLATRALKGFWLPQ